jgi:hypothetical protein
MKLPVSGKITSNFGIRNDPISGKPTQHNGIDISCVRGTAVISLFGGVVTDRGNDSVRGVYLGITKNGVTEWFLHLTSSTVKIGDSVMSGKMVALSGNTGKSTGPHLHYGIKVNGNWVDPLKYISGNVEKVTMDAPDERETEVLEETFLSNVNNFVFNLFVYILLIGVVLFSVYQVYGKDIIKGVGI